MVASAHELFLPACFADGHVLFEPLDLVAQIGTILSLLG